jgi:hypothetical protein
MNVQSRGAAHGEGNRRRGRSISSPFKLLASSVACLGLLAAVTGCHSADPKYASTLVNGDYATVASTEQSFFVHYSVGEWMPSRYTTSDWEQYQSAAVGEAVLGALPGGTQVQRQVAVDTVNQAIRTHQMSNGDFDNGTPASGSSGVNGPLWAEAEGLIALELKPYLDAGTLASWTASMMHYVDYLSSSGNLLWYANGNQALRHALVALETKMLSGSSTYAQDYASAMQSALDPTMGGAYPQWSAYGLKYSTIPTKADGSDGSGWLVESANGGHPSEPPQCANGQNPCNGFDPHYTMLQLHEALTGYALSDDPQWLRLVNLETNQLMPLVDHGTWMLNASNGSRDTIPSEALYPQALGVFDEHNLRGDLSPAINWPKQLQPVTQEFTYYASLASPGPDAFGLIPSVAIPLIDAQRTEGGAATTTGGPGTATGGPGTTAVLPAGTRPLPAVSGTATVGHVLSASTGSWSGTAAISFAYRWQRCKPFCANIAGASRSSYRLVAADVGARMRVVVTASNPAGSASAASASVGPVAAAAPSVGQLKASLRSALTSARRAARITALLRKDGYSFWFKALTAGRLVISWYLLPKGAHIARSKPKPVLVATGRLVFSKGSTGRTTLKLTAGGKKLFRRAKSIRLTAEGSFTPIGEPAVVATQTFTFGTSEPVGIMRGSG